MVSDRLNESESFAATPNNAGNQGGPSPRVYLGAALRGFIAIVIALLSVVSGIFIAELSSAIPRILAEEVVGVSVALVVALALVRLFSRISFLRALEVMGLAPPRVWGWMCGLSLGGAGLLVAVACWLLWNPAQSPVHLGWLNTVGLGPALEETIFRGYLLASCVSTRSSVRWCFILVSGLSFSAMHWPALTATGAGQGITVCCVTLILGCALAWLVLFHGWSVWKCMGVHGVLNAVAGVCEVASPGSRGLPLACFAIVLLTCVSVERTPRLRDALRG